MDAWNWRRSAAVKAFVLSLPPLKEGTRLRRGADRLRPCTVYDKQLTSIRTFWTLNFVLHLRYFHTRTSLRRFLRFYPNSAKENFHGQFKAMLAKSRWSVKQTMALHEDVFPPARLWIGHENSSPMHGWSRSAQIFSAKKWEYDLRGGEVRDCTTYLPNCKPISTFVTWKSWTTQTCYTARGWCRK